MSATLTRPAPRPQGSAPGFVVIDKPCGMTSHDVVARVRRTVGTRRVGHAGTLDPGATGVLVCAVGTATRLLSHLGSDSKDYEVQIVLGEGRHSDDADGTVTDQPGIGMLGTEDELRAAVVRASAGLTGEIMQVPPQVSAKHVGGHRAHALVRAGERVDLPAVPVRVDSFTLTSLVAAPAGSVTTIPVWLAGFTVTVSAGTYVRALARDLAAALGTAGYVHSLRRTRAGAWTLADAVTLAGLAADPPGCLLSPLTALARVMACYDVDAAGERDLRHGRAVAGPPEPSPAQRRAALAGPAGTVAVADWRAGQWHPMTVLMP